MTIQQQEMNYNVKKFNSGLALPIFSISNLCNRKPTHNNLTGRKMVMERKKKEKIENEVFLHLKVADMSRVQNYTSRGIT